MKLFQLPRKVRIAERRQHRRRDRHDDRPEDPELVGAVDPGRLEQLVRDAQHELAHQEHAEGPGEERQDQARIGVHEPEVAHQDEVRDERDPGRHHERGEDEAHDHPLAAPAQLGERVAEHRAEHEVADGHGKRDDRRVEEEPREVELIEQPAVVVGGGCRRQERRRVAQEVGLGLDRPEEHPQERPDHEHETTDAG